MNILGRANPPHRRGAQGKAFKRRVGGRGNHHIDLAPVQIVHQERTAADIDLQAQTRGRAGDVAEHRRQDGVGDVMGRADAQHTAQAALTQGVEGVIVKRKHLPRMTQKLQARFGEALEKITNSVVTINERNLVIASTSEEQAQVVREVDRNLLNIQDLLTQTAAGASQTSASSQEFSRLAVSFNTLVTQFKL